MTNSSKRHMSDQEAVREQFQEFKHLAENATVDEKIGVSIAVNLANRIFQSRYKSAEEFRDAPLDERMSYLDYGAANSSRNLNDEANGIVPVGTSIGFGLAQMYFASLAYQCDSSLTNEISEFIEPFNRMGYEIEQGFEDHSDR